MPLKRIPDIPSTCLHVNIIDPSLRNSRMGDEYSASKYERNFSSFYYTFFWSYYMHFCLVTQCTCI